MRRDPLTKIVAIERFRAGLCKEGMLQQAIHGLGVYSALSCRFTIYVSRSAAARAHEIIEQCISGAGIARDWMVLAINKRDVGNAAEIEHDDRMRTVERARQRAMVHGDQRSPLPA